MSGKLGMGWAPLILGSALGMSSPPALPLWLAGAAERFQLSAQESGLIGSFELGCLALSSIAWAAKTGGNRRGTWLLLAIVMGIIGNLVSFFAPTAPVLILARGLVGLSFGLTLTEITRRAALQPEPHRVFAAQQFGLVLFVATFFATVPMAMARIGPGAPFLYITALGVLALVSMAWLPAEKPVTPSGLPTDKEAGTRGKRASSAIAMVFGAVAITYLTQSALWTYITAAAKNSGVDVATLGKVLAVGAVLNLLAPIVAGQIGLRLGRIFPLLIGFALLAISILLVASGASPIAFIAGATGLNFALLFVTPFLLGALAALDASGRSAAAGPAFFTIGGAAGPALAGFVIGGLGFGLLGAILALGAVFAFALAVKAVSGISRIGGT